MHGCTVHQVTAELDSGDIIAHESVIIEPEDTVEILTAKVLEKELTLYPKVLQNVAKQKLDNQIFSSSVNIT